MMAQLPTDPAAEPIPQPLLQKLHDATQTFHLKRRQLDQVHEDFNAELNARAEAIQQVQKAEKELEAISETIAATFPDTAKKLPAPSSPR